MTGSRWSGITLEAHANRQPRVPAAAPISYALFRAGMMACLSAFSASRRPDNPPEADGKRPRARFRQVGTSMAVGQ